MEQRRGSSSQPLEGAGFDPAFIPGLTAPAAGGPEDVRGGKPDADAEADAGPETDGVEDAVPSARESAEDLAEPEEEAAPVDGPVFEAADRRARIVADHKGVRLSLDDQACEFRWDEVGAVETETGRFGKRFTVTVHTPDRRWYPIEIEADSRGRFAEWESALDEVLDTYFEDGEAADETEPAADADTDAGAKDDADAKDGAEPGRKSPADTEE